MLENYKYTTLHNHSEYSNLRLIDSLNRIPEMFNYCIELGLNGLALTDHEVLSGSKKFFDYYNSLDEEVKANFKPIIGNEIYLVDEQKQKRMYHFILLAKNLDGFNLLKELSTNAWSKSYNLGKMTRVPTLKEDLKSIIGENGTKDLVASTACLGGEFPQLVLELVNLEKENADINIINSKKQEIVDFVLLMQNLFGKENFFFEIQPSRQKDQIIFNKKCKQLSKAFSVPMIVTTDSHYLNEADKPVHTAFLKSKDGDRETGDFYDSAYFMSAQEICDFPSIKENFTEEEMIEIFENTNKIANMCETYSLFQQQQIPRVDKEEQLRELLKKHSKTIEKDIENQEHLIRIYQDLKDGVSRGIDRYSIVANGFWLLECYDFLVKKNLCNETYISRLNLEAEELWGVSENMGESIFSYYVTMTEIMKICWDDANAIVGPGRGSVSGYLSAYCLGITDVDSIAYDLPHWRHLTKERPELPDIDFDTPSSRRANILLATKKYFGEDKVLSIATFKTEGTKSAVLTACRGYRSEDFPHGIDSDVGDFLTSMVKSERGFDWTINDMINGNRDKDRLPVTSFITEIKKYPGLLEIVQRVEGVISGRSIHASGVYIYNESYLKYNAMMKAPNGQATTQFDMSDSDYMGGLKFDFLTVTGFDIIHTCLDLLQEDGYIETRETLKETFDAVLASNKLVDSQDYWDHASKREMLKVFQLT